MPMAISLLMPRYSSRDFQKMTHLYSLKSDTLKNLINCKRTENIVTSLLHWDHREKNAKFVFYFWTHCLNTLLEPSVWIYYLNALLKHLVFTYNRAWIWNKVIWRVWLSKSSLIACIEYGKTRKMSKLYN